MEKLPPISYIVLPPWQTKKMQKWRVNLSFTPLLLHHITPNAVQKDVRVLSCIFLKNPPIAAPLFVILGGKFQPGYVCEWSRIWTHDF